MKKPDHVISKDGVMPFLLMSHTEELLRNGVKSFYIECHPEKEDAWHVVLLGEEGTIIPREVGLGELGETLREDDEAKTDIIMALLGTECIQLLTKDVDEAVDMICKGLFAVMVDFQKVAPTLSFMQDRKQTLQTVGSA